jgi:prepilin-type N-terminal cleavage/methylation domain-containing protein
MKARRPAPAGFTLVEVLCSLLILSLVSTLVFGSYFQVVKAKRKGEALLDRIRQSDWVMDQIVVALRSSVMLENNPKKCAFWLEDDESTYPADVISWVTSSAAFMPPRSQMAYGLHRIFLSIEDDENGEPALHASAYPYLADDSADDFEDPEPWLVSRRIKGLSCRVYDEFNKEWADEYEKDDAVPTFVEITLTIAPEQEGAEPVEITRAVQMPAGSFAKNRRRMQNNENTGTDGTNSANGGAADNGGLQVNQDPRIIQGGGGMGGGNNNNNGGGRGGNR